MSLDGFVAGPNHAMDWMTGISVRSGLIDEYVEITGAVLGGRDGWDAARGNRPYGGEGDPPSAVNVRYRPTTTARITTERES
jgi:hypothetical protein